jgi:hypothetical protein
MADLKISELPGATTPLDETELLEIVQSGSNKKVPVSGLFTRFLGHTLVYSGGLLDHVDCFLDAAKTQLHRKFVMIRTGNKLTSVEIRNASNALLQTIALTYSGEKLSGATKS